MARMHELKPTFCEDSSSTAGNRSQVSDGAAATLSIKRRTAKEPGLSSSITGKWVATKSARCHPDEMGVGPAVAVRRLLEVMRVMTRRLILGRSMKPLPARLCTPTENVEAGKTGSI